MWYGGAGGVARESLIISPPNSRRAFARVARGNTTGRIRSGEAAFRHSASSATQASDSLRCVRAIRGGHETSEAEVVRGSAFNRICRRVLSERGKGGRLGRSWLFHTIARPAAVRCPYLESQTSDFKSQTDLGDTRVPGYDIFHKAAAANYGRIVTAHPSRRIRPSANN